MINGSCRALTNLQKNLLWTKTSWSCLNKTNTPLAYTTASKSQLLKSSQSPLNASFELNPKNQFASILFGSNAKMNRYYSTKDKQAEEAEKVSQNQENKNEEEQKKEQPKKQSKFKQLYSQYGPIFLVVHLTTVVLWIYSFFLISKQ